MWLLSTNAHAVPSFARQTNLQCIACHTEFPVLTNFGHQFKLNGYVMSAGQSFLPPLAVLLQPSFTQTAASQPGGAAPSFSDNNNFAVSQASLFYAGRVFGPYADKLLGADAAAVANKFGIFFQTTYDGVAKTWSWDNAELRFADTKQIMAHEVAYGFYLNNNPTMQDLWNTTPAWTFPFSGSGLAPTPAAATLVDGSVGQQVGGLGAYTMIANKLYLDLGAYRTLGANFLRSVGVDTEGEQQITGLAPYWRVAYEVPLENNARWEFGTFGMAAKAFPDRVSTAGKDHYVDVGIDSEYQISVGRHDLTALFSWISERESWEASNALEGTSNTKDHLHTAKATVDYLYDKTYGFAIQYFAIDGSIDPLLYGDSATGSPKSDGFIFQLNWMPLNKNGGPGFWPRSNIKFSAQYTAYAHFDGAKMNYDGSGRNASDNNTLYLEAWIMF